MTYELIGGAALKKKLEAVTQVVRHDFWLAVRDDYESNLMRNIRPHSDTGRLERNAYVKPIANGVEGGIRDNGMLVTWRGKRVNYAYFVHEGSRPHKIEPKKKKALRWTAGGSFAFAKSVKHPGYSGDPFLENAAKKTFRRLDDIFKKELEKKQW